MHTHKYCGLAFGICFIDEYDTSYSIKDNQHKKWDLNIRCRIDTDDTEFEEKQKEFLSKERNKKSTNQIYQ